MPSGTRERVDTTTKEGGMKMNKYDWPELNPNYSYTEEEIKWALDSIIEQSGRIPTSTIVLNFLRKTIQEE